ncbi:transmembrane emp24 domain-containing protein 6-like isoform X2 [Electrophorus electricus]|uniref:transmembrane emp24 domain-containing protein 6-like isoform X2 n=1 Tax=Electrophorus electricus TaxID=8005 RepID=UPI000F0A4A30|nr:transmembrane emp24 domain-containing protein 6-like isoform X2 [Electrophorus electricus]
MHCIACTLVLLIFLHFGQWSEGQEGRPDADHRGHDLFQGADHYDFAIVLSGTESQCYWHFAQQTGRFYLTYMVQWVSGMMAHRHTAVSILSPKGLLLSYTDDTKGQMSFRAKESAEAQRENGMEEVILNSTFSNIEGISRKIRIQIQQMWHFYNIERMHRGTDLYLLQSKSSYVNTWSALQSLVIILTGYIQFFFLKKFFCTQSNRSRC